MRITKYNPDFANTEKFDEEECFYMQLTDDEKYEYNEMEIEYLSNRIDNLYDEIHLNNFKIERNHPDRELYRTDSMSNTPCVEYVECLEEHLKDLKKKQKLLDEKMSAENPVQFISNASN